jgi:hypothetical protein
MEKRKNLRKAEKKDRIVVMEFIFLKGEA